MSALAKSRAQDLRLPPDVILAWLEKKKISLRRLERGEPVWPGESGALEPLTLWRVEQLIAERDPVYWAFLNLIEEQSVRDDDGKILTPAGVPWTLFPIQAKLARIRGNLVVESASEVGKTRDIILRALWNADSPKGAESILIAANLDSSVQRIWAQIEFQVSKNPLIGGGVKHSRVKPFRQMTFNNDKRIDLTMCGFDGEQLRDIHVQLVLADEVAKWKNQSQWDELWRAGVPGAEFRPYSTPDGDYSSPFYGLCQRAVPLEKTSAPDAAPPKAPKGSADEPKFRKINITKMDLPYPFWSEARAASKREQYGGESSVGWLTKVLGKWGSPSFSVFPMPTLKPNLKYLADYRIVVAKIDRDARQVFFSAARMGAGSGSVDGRWGEEMLARDPMPFVSGKQLAETVCDYFPSIADWKDPLLFCGGDLGSSKDPSEFIWRRVIGQKWRDVFRLHLEHADWPEQAAIVARLDHVSGHRVKYGLDNGSAGSALVQVLTQMDEFRRCPVCEAAVYFEERLFAFGFGEKTDEIDLVTGEPLLNPDRKDAKGNLMPRRISNKELGTRLMERKLQAKEEEIAWDGGAGDERLSGPQLLINHTASKGLNSKGERNFRQEDDHYVDARRLAALVILKELRPDGAAPSPALDNVVSIESARAAHRVFEGAPAAAGGIRGLFQHGTGVQGLFR